MEANQASFGDKTYYSRSRSVGYCANRKYSLHAIESLAFILYTNLDIADRRYYFKTYKSCFIGQDLVDYLVNNDFCSSRSDGVALGNILFQNKYIEHISNKHGFEDKYIFYRFTLSSISCNMKKPRAMSSPCNDNELLLTKTVRKKQKSNINDPKIMYLKLMDELSSITSDCWLMALAFVLYRNLNIRDRRYHFKTYKKCFIGSDLVDYLIHNEFCSKRVDAVILGNNLLQNGYIRHVVDEHGFDDKYLFYCFRNPTQKFKYGFQKIEAQHLDISRSNDVDLSNVTIVEEYAVIIADV